MDYPRGGAGLKSGKIVKNDLAADLNLFKRGLHFILEHGWIQNTGGNLEDGVCFNGALTAAIHEQIGFEYSKEYVYTHPELDICHTLHPATFKFYNERIDPFVDIPGWNDDPDRTEAEVISLYRAIIEHLEGLLGIGGDIFAPTSKEHDAISV